MARSDSGDSGLSKAQPCVGSAGPLGLEWPGQGHRDERESRVKKSWSLRGNIRDFVFYPKCKPWKVYAGEECDLCT